MSDVTFEIRAESVGTSDRGHGLDVSGAGRYCSVCVEDDGTVLVYDWHARHYRAALGEALTEAERAEARRLAALVRAGTHRVIDGEVVPV